MIRNIFIFFSILSILSIYSTYKGIGLEGVNSSNTIKHNSTRRSSVGSWGNSGFSYGK